MTVVASPLAHDASTAGRTCDLPGYCPPADHPLHRDIDTSLPAAGSRPWAAQPDATFGDDADQPLKRFVRQPCGNVKTTHVLVRFEPQ